MCIVSRTAIIRTAGSCQGGEYRITINGGQRRLRQAIVNPAKTEAILASALAGIAADPQSFPHPDSVPEAIIQWWEGLKSACRTLFDKGAELYWLSVVFQLAQEDPTRRLLNALEPRLPHINITANLVRTLIGRAKSLQ